MYLTFLRRRQIDRVAGLRDATETPVTVVKSHANSRDLSSRGVQAVAGGEAICDRCMYLGCTN